MTAALASACSPAASNGKVGVVASFYPLQFAAEQVGGSFVQVTNLTKPGAEPHDLELSPGDVVTVARARLVVFEHGVAPAVDSAVTAEAKDHALDVSTAADLSLTYTPIEGGQANPQAAGSVDPHFWLDPVRYAAVAQALADRLASLDPAHKAQYERNAAAFKARLALLNRQYAQGLASCARADLVTSHNAFGYLAARYHLHQIGITGLSPDAEPSPTILADVATYVRRHHVSTIYAETLASPAIAQTVANETGARLATLDPIEGLTAKSAGRDYFAIMQANLAALRRGQGCG
jgi:zinc transport system substrate-binding protein